MEPSPEEIAFARKRRQLSDELAPYFLECIQAADFESFNLDGDIDTLGGGPPKPDTLYGQAFIFRAQVKALGRDFQEVQLLIQHTENWLPAVTVLSGDGGPTQTVIIRDDLEGATAKVKQLIDDTIAKLASR